MVFLLTIMLPLWKDYLRWKRSVEMDEIKKLAISVGRHPVTVFRWLKRTRRVGLEDAVLLEKATGIPRLAWLYPDEFHNPMIEKYQKAS
jgi:hypothetical protein